MKPNHTESQTTRLRVERMDCPEEIEEQSFGTSHAMDVLCLCTFSTFVSLWGLCAGPGLSDHEAIVAQGARQMRQGDGWLIPHVGDVPFVRKPPLAFWLTGAASLVVDPPQVQPPVSPFAARLPSALASILTTMLIYALGRSMFGHRIGMVCGGAMTICAGALYFSHNAQIEMVLTCLCTASFTFFWFGTQAGRWRGVHMILFYVSFALAMLAKAPLPLATVGFPLFVWWFVTAPVAGLDHSMSHDGHAPSLKTRVWQQALGLRGLRLIPGILLFSALFLPWPVYVYTRIDHVLELWRLEFFARYSGGLLVKAKPFWYYVPIALLIVFPFSLSLPAALASPFRETYRRHRKGLLFAFSWAAVQAIFLSSSAFKRPHYLIAAAPAFALLLGPTLDRLFLASRTFSRRNVGARASALVVAVPLALVAGKFFVAREYPRILPAYTGAGFILTLGSIACAIAFVKRHRPLSLALLHVFVALCFMWIWNFVGQSRSLQWQAFAMVEQLKTQSIGEDDRITWAVGRPDARLMYYMERKINALFSPLEVAPQRASRKTIPQELLAAGAQRLVERLSGDDKEYFIIDADYWTRFRQGFDPPAREVLRVFGDDEDDDGDDWVLITNRWNTGE